MTSYDQTQIGYLGEHCILVNDNDDAVGWDTKKACHLRSNHFLHRAFSVFVFHQNKLLLQKRSAFKITFPLHFTNSCCSHPLQGGAEELGVEGVKLAAVRKLNHELGLVISPSDLIYLTRMYYQAPYDDTWSEHEIDYILFVKLSSLNLNPNLNEVESVQSVDQAELLELLLLQEQGAVKFTPWFNMLVKSGWLDRWWKGLADLNEFQDYSTIHRLT